MSSTVDQKYVTEITVIKNGKVVEIESEKEGDVNNGK